MCFPNINWTTSRLAEIVNDGATTLGVGTGVHAHPHVHRNATALIIASDPSNAFIHCSHPQSCVRNIDAIEAQSANAVWDLLNWRRARAS
jgi:hypothetical protein